jgi:hypothetical protein
MLNPKSSDGLTREHLTAECAADLASIAQARRYMEVELIRIRSEVSMMLNTIVSVDIDSHLKDLFNQADDLVTDTFTMMERDVPEVDDVMSDRAMAFAEQRYELAAAE